MIIVSKRFLQRLAVAFKYRANRQRLGFNDRLGRMGFYLMHRHVDVVLF